MKLETGKDKIQKICDALRKETIEPAQQEVREIIENAHIQATEIVKNAKKQAEEKIASAEKEIEERKKVFHSSLQLAARQGIEELKQKIEKELFSQELAEFTAKEMGNPKIIGEILNAFLRMVEEKGIEDTFIATIPKTISPRSISAILVEKNMERLKEHAITVGDFAGGIKIGLKGRQITIDISDQVVRELISQYIRRDFRDLVFGI